MTRSVLIAAAAAVLGGAATAGAQTSHILGWDGPKVALDVTCRRAVIAPPGESVKMGLNVTAQQVKCVIRRPDPFARCVRHLGVPPIVGQVNKDDWTHVDRLDQYVASVYACSHAHLR
jgi:hypothetical protein